jgi:hypothetical protein
MLRFNLSGLLCRPHVSRTNHRQPNQPELTCFLVLELIVKSCYKYKYSYGIPVGSLQLKKRATRKESHSNAGWQSVGYAIIILLLLH